MSCELVALTATFGVASGVASLTVLLGDERTALHEWWERRISPHTDGRAARWFSRTRQ